MGEIAQGGDPGHVPRVVVSVIVELVHPRGPDHAGSTMSRRRRLDGGRKRPQASRVARAVLVAAAVCLPPLIASFRSQRVLRAAAPASSGCRVLGYTFEPDCLVRDADQTCRFSVARPDLGPQVAVWIESADGATFVDTLMVTSAVALQGIGNRPGRWDFKSGPRFPYGRRPMALPIWAHRRGKLYPAVVMNDGRDDEMTAHEEVSSPEPFFCRPMLASEVVDAVTCASGTFRSAKGLLDASAAPSYYPPRGDLVDWGDVCVPKISVAGSSCDFGDARQYGVLDDLDAVATATPAYDQTFRGTWTVPATLPEGDYVLAVEVTMIRPSGR